jgi:Protein of unknown function (DUF3606)
MTHATIETVTIDDRKNERNVIDVTKPEDIKYWTEQFGANAEQLRGAVEAVGLEVPKVEAYLKEHHASTRDD